MAIRFRRRNISVPIPSVERKTVVQKCKFPVEKNVPIGRIVCTKHGWDICLVGEITNKGKPTKIYGKYNPCSGDAISDALPTYGGIKTVTWYDTGIDITVDEWIKLGNNNDASSFKILIERRFTV